MQDDAAPLMIKTRNSKLNPPTPIPASGRGY